MQLLLVGPAEPSFSKEALETVRAMGWSVTHAENYREAVDSTRHGRVDVVLATQPHADDEGDPESLTGYKELIQCLQDRRIVGLIRSNGKGEAGPSGPSLLDVVGPDLSSEELRGRLIMIERYQGVLRELDQELDHMQRLGERLRQHFLDVEEEMRLAGRLQRDFLPDLSKPKANLQFAGLYRPASWVSGDIYNVFRLDQDHTGFYLADAVGHGMAASLLTMFINRTLAPIPGRAVGDPVPPPSETIAVLNRALLDQSLPSCQFVTAWYGLFQHSTRTLRFARGGHPYPLLIRASGQVREIKCGGGLLGVFEQEEFPTGEVRLEPGDRVLLYTDGVEHVFPELKDVTQGASPWINILEPHAHLPIQDLVNKLEERLINAVGSLAPHDDVSFVGFELLDG